MNSLDVEGFMMSQKAKITEEKARLANPRETKGILPSDSVALERSDRLRTERKSEYQDYIKRRNHSKRSIAEIRTELAQDREAELGQRKNERDSSRTRLEEGYADDKYAAIQDREAELGQWKSERDSSRTRLEEGCADDKYAALRAKKLYEERCYRGDPYYHKKPRKHKDVDEDDNRRDHLSNIKFAGKISGANQQKSTWDEEERDIMQWTRNKGRSCKALTDKGNTPPVDCTRVNEADSRAMFRSISAPIAAPAMPLPGWGGDDSHVKKMKKMKYAEDLRNQIREKKASVKHNEALHITADQHLPYNHLNRARANRSVADNNGMGAILHHQDYSSHKYENVQKPPPMPSRPVDMSKQGYVPPPPSLQGHPGGPWTASGYPYPTYLDRESYPEMYHHPYYYPPPNSYAPPHNYPPPHNYIPPHNYFPYPVAVDPCSMLPSHHRRESHKHLAFRKPGQGEDHYDLIDHNKRSYSPPYPLRQDSNERGGPPSWRSNKLTYREELENQMKEKKEREAKEKSAMESLDKKRETEFYDPFGKGGCGAPVRDQHGNLVADLKQMRLINENRLSNNSLKLKNSAESDDLDMSMSSSPQKESHTILTYGKRDDKDLKKSAQISYRDYLRQQVKEKEELKMKERERLKMDEQKELDHLARDRKRIQEEYQQELDLQKMKEEQARRKNELIKLEAEKERQRVSMLRERERIQEEAEQRSFAEKELVEKLSCPRGVGFSHDAYRSSSPPIPTLRRQMNAVPSVTTPDTQPQIHFPSNFPGNVSYQPASGLPLLDPSSPDPTEQKMECGGSLRTSPPVPTLRKKKNKTSNTELETSKANSCANICSNPPASGAVEGTQICGDTNRVLDDTRRITCTGVNGNHPNQPHASSKIQDHTLDVDPSVRSHRPTGAFAVGDVRLLSSGRQLSALDSEEILTKLGAIRMHLQEELAKQNCESHSQSDIFERAKRHVPRLAAPLKSKDCATMQAIEDFNKLKYSNSTERTEFLDMYPETPRSENTLTVQQRALLRHQHGLKRQAQMNIERQKRHTNRKDSVGKSSENIERNTLPPEFSPRCVGYSLGNDNDSLSLTSTHDRASLLDDFSRISHRQVHPDTDGGSMATRNEERIKRLETILNSGTYNKHTLGARWHSGSLERVKEGERRLAHTHRANSSIQNSCPSIQSEMSLDCETQHLPA